MPRYHKILIATNAAVLIWSAIKPHDYLTLLLETFPLIIGFIILAFTYKKFQLTNLAYTLITTQAIILMIGGHYTYVEVPFFSWLQDTGIFARNNYDKLGHFIQGFGPAIIAREILLRTSPLRPGKWLNFLVVAIAGFIAAIYEIIEWVTAASIGSASDSFLATQGYVWDTQTDMALCLIGAILSLLLLSKLHDRQLNEIGTKN
ncbi:MAG: DUF2238 domain-containing protein [Candidatus Magasanikbacteria bacterium]|nr:DUF2238 domain-containing protein [Candidatus Magasanikbacteria bacterium]